MKHHFQLQYKMLNRHLIDFGITPIIAYVLLIVAFVLGSHQLFLRLGFAPYVYAFIALSSVSKLSVKERNDFLKLTFTFKKYIKIRVVENSLLVIPFVVFLIYKQAYLIGLVLFVLAIALSSIKLNVNSNFTIPSPFKKHPFEFTEGFRKTFFVFPLAYFLTIVGIKVGNFNLAIFSLLLIFGVSISYFSKTEKSFYVWLHKQTPKDFLHYKIKTAFKYVSFLTLPILIALSIFFTSKIVVVIIFQLIGYVYLAQFILAKYTAFPKQMSLPISIVYGISFVFPPLVFFTFNHFYKKAIEQLNIVLDD